MVSLLLLFVLFVFVCLFVLGWGCCVRRKMKRMTRCIACQVTNIPPSSTFVLDVVICAPTCEALACRTHQTDRAKQPRRHNSTSCSLVLSAGREPGISSSLSPSPRKIRYRRSYKVPRNSLQKKTKQKQNKTKTKQTNKQTNKKTQFTSSSP